MQPLQPDMLVSDYNEMPLSSPEPPPARPPPPFSDKTIDDWNQKINDEFNNIYETLKRKPDTKVYQNVLPKVAETKGKEKKVEKGITVTTVPDHQKEENKNCLPVQIVKQLSLTETSKMKETKSTTTTTSTRIESNDFSRQISNEKKQPTQSEADLFIKRAEAEEDQIDDISGGNGRGSLRAATLLTLKLKQKEDCFE